MKEVKIDLTNCYGINHLSYTFDYSEGNSIVIYAPNGSMKSSLAKTLMKISENSTPEEKLYDKKPIYEIKIDHEDVKSENIFVIESFNENFTSDNLSTLLVNKKQKMKYDTLVSEINTIKQKMITDLQKISKIKKTEVEKTILKD